VPTPNLSGGRSPQELPNVLFQNRDEQVPTIRFLRLQLALAPDWFPLLGKS
jgi:hypothetical protein